MLCQPTLVSNALQLLGEADSLSSIIGAEKFFHLAVDRDWSSSHAVCF